MKSLDMSKELAALQHEKKNQALKKLPPNTSIQRRPLAHPAVAPPQAGSHIQKVVYVSCRTPIMSAVKRVKKLLQHVEKRALQGIEAKNGGKSHLNSNLKELSDKLAKESEEILVKASGRAMEQALRVAEWFRNKETEFSCNVDVRTDSVAAVDDLITNNDTDSTSDPNQDRDYLDADPDITGEPAETTLEGGDTTMDILGDKSTVTAEQNLVDTHTVPSGKASYAKDAENRKRRRRKRKREVYDQVDMPEARIRWVKTVEVVISLKA